jgi:hypothetical protein
MIRLGFGRPTYRFRTALSGPLPRLHLDIPLSTCCDVTLCANTVATPEQVSVPSVHSLNFCVCAVANKKKQKYTFPLLIWRKWWMEKMRNEKTSVPRVDFSNYGRMRMSRSHGKSYRTKHSVLMIILISKIPLTIGTDNERKKNAKTSWHWTDVLCGARWQEWYTVYLCVPHDSHNKQRLFP